MNPLIPKKYRNISKEGCKLEDFSFLGANLIIFPEVIKGEGALIGAGSAVRSNLKSWGIYIMRNRKVIKIRDQD